MRKNHLRIITFITAASFTLSFSSCQSTKGDEVKESSMLDASYSFPYTLNQPSEKFIMPSDLDEISSVEVLPNGTLACIQDEKGILFVYDTSKKEIVKRYKFADDGDYEGIALVDETLYVLRSDGDLYQVPRQGGEEATVKIETILSDDNDTEGLAYDPIERQLLIACKADAGLDKKKKKHKSVYAFNLLVQEVIEEPRIYLDLEELTDQLQKKKQVTFDPSGIAVHPLTGNFYLIASSGNRLLVLNRKGELLYQQELKGKNYKQPEGITFDAQGTLYISNEARDGEANILKFAFQP